MSTDTDISAIAAAEREIQVPRVDHLFAWQVAEALFDVSPAPLVLRVASPTQCVLHVAQPGTNRFNEEAVIRKIDTVFALNHSTLWWNTILSERGMTSRDHPLVDDARYTDIEGGVPLYAGENLIGAAAVSGLAPRDDHDVLIAALRRALT